jgi:hypothetical protein
MSEKFKTGVEKINQSLKPYYSLLIMIVFFMGTFITGYKIIVKSPDLRVHEIKDNIDYPNSINECYKRVFDSFNKQNSDSSLRADAINVYEYLLRTKQQERISLKNETEKTLEKVDIRIINVSGLTSWAVSSDYLADEEKTKLMRSVKYDERSGEIYLSEKFDILPKGAITFYLWGQFDESVWNNNLRVTYDGGMGFLEKSIQVSGFKAYIDEYWYEIIFFMLLVVCVVFIFTIKGKEHENSPAEKNSSINS